MRNKPWLIVGLIAVIVAVAAALLRTPSEPVYHGKPLSNWLRGYSATARGEAPMRGEAEAAIRAIGTNAIPTLLHMIEHRDNPLEDRMLSLAQKIPFLRIQRVSPLDPNYEAVMAFKVLGTKAGSAVPRLIEIYNHEPDRDTKFWVISALAEIGPAAEPAVPILLHTLSGTNTRLRENAARALGEIHADASVVVPPLISCLNDPDPTLRLAAVFALRNFGKEAKAAAPALRELVRDAKRSAGPIFAGTFAPGVSVPTIGEMATNALWEIDPDAAAKAGMRDPW
jgi:HEAT repeat protein